MIAAALVQLKTADTIETIQHTFLTVSAATSRKDEFKAYIVCPFYHAYVERMQNKVALLAIILAHFKTK